MGAREEKLKRLKDKLRKVLNDHKTVTAVAQEMLPTVLYALIEKGHLGDWSPENNLDVRALRFCA